ncbi:MAG: hemolysin III family protein [Acidobacteria bacterium]|nr:hemolysin III family protein [Acidobacteriota bacterium]
MFLERRLDIEEIANSITHGFGAMLSVIGFVVLMSLAWTRGDGWHLLGCGIFGAALVMLYTASTLYHGFRHPQLKQIFRLVDQIAIYLLIAGTYTPFMLVNMRCMWGWALLMMVWTLALFGIGFKLIFGQQYQRVSLLLYLLTSWISLIAVKPIFAMIPQGALLWIGLGGVAYMIGLVFFLWEKLPFSHPIWHVCVLAGSFCHFCAVMFYVLPSFPAPDSALAQVNHTLLQFIQFR